MLTRRRRHHHIRTLRTGSVCCRAAGREPTRFKSVLVFIWRHRVSFLQDQPAAETVPSLDSLLPRDDVLDGLILLNHFVLFSVARLLNFSIFLFETNKRSICVDRNTTAEEQLVLILEVIRVDGLQTLRWF